MYEVLGARAGGAFVVTELIERVLRDGTGETKKDIGEWFKPFRNEVAGWDSKGSGVLAEKVATLCAQ